MEWNVELNTYRHVGLISASKIRTLAIDFYMS